MAVKDDERRDRIFREWQLVQSFCGQILFQTPEERNITLRHQNPTQYTTK